MFRNLPITDVYAQKIFDTQGNITAEVKVTAGENCLGKMKIPHGAGDVRKLISDINEKNARELMEMNVFAQKEIDHVLGQLNEESGVMYAISMAAARCAAKAMKVPLYRYLGGVGVGRLPMPLAHVASCANQKAGQMQGREFLLMPVGAKNCIEALKMCVRVSQHFQKEQGIRKENLMSEEAEEELLNLLKRVAKNAGYQPGRDVYFVTDSAAMENAIWLRPNKCGTISKAISTIEKMQSEGKVVILRSEAVDSEDTSIVDLAVATGCSLLKLEAPGRWEYVAKYNRLMEIEEALGTCAEFSTFQQH